MAGVARSCAAMGRPSARLLLLTALGLAGCVDTFARRDDANCRAMGAQRGTDRYDNCRMTLKENRNGVVTVRVR